MITCFLIAGQLMMGGPNGVAPVEKSYWKQQHVSVSLFSRIQPTLVASSEGRAFVLFSVKDLKESGFEVVENEGNDTVISVLKQCEEKAKKAQ